MAENVAKLRALRRTAGNLLPQIYHHAHALPAGGRYQGVLALIKAHPDLAAKLVKKFGAEHPRGVNLEKVDKAGLEAVREAAGDIVTALAPLYGLLEEIAIFQEHTLRVLTDLSQALLPFSLEYTPELLDSFMGLFTEACKVHILAAKMPRPLILQMYALAFDFRHNADPPHFKEISLFVVHYQDVFPRLQAEFQPVSIRLGEILEKIVAPALRIASDFRQLRGSDFFSLALSGVGDAADTSKCPAGTTAAQMYSAIQRLDSLREWAVFGVLVCPGETVRSEVRSLVVMVLKDSFKQTVYRNHSEWIHLLFEKYVVPSMTSAAKKSPFGFGGKKDLKKIVERGFGEACDCAMAEHHTRRTWLLQHLEAVNTLLQEEPGVLMRRREMVMALLSLSRSEVQWIMQHGGEALPRGLPISWVRPGLYASQPLKAGFPDVTIVLLLSAHCELLAAAQRYGVAMRCHVTWQMWDQLSVIVQPMFEQVASAPTLTKQHQPVIQTIEQLLCKYSEVCEVLLQAWSSGPIAAPSSEEQPQQELVAQQVEHTIEALPAVQDIWFSLNAQLFSVRTNVTGQSLDALIPCRDGDPATRAAGTSSTRDAESAEAAELTALSAGLGGGATRAPSIVKELNHLSDLSQAAADIDASLREAGSLQALCFHVPRLQTLFMAAMHSGPDIARHSTAFLPVLSSFHLNDVPKFNEDHGKVAEDLADQLMTAVTSHLRTLLYDLCKLAFSSPEKDAPSAPHLHQASTTGAHSRDPPTESTPGGGGSVGGSGGVAGPDVLSASHSSLALPSPAAPRNLSVSLSAVMKGSKSLISSISAAEGAGSGLFLPPTPPGSSMEALWHCEASTACMASVIALIQACTPSPLSGRHTAVSRRKAIAAEEWLRDGITSTFRTVVRQAAWSGKNLHRPTQLEKKVECFCSMLSVLQDYTAIDLGMLVREVLIGQTFIPLPGADQEGASPERSRFSPAGPRRQIGSVSSNKSVSQIADWLLSHVVRDRSDAGVAYSVRKLTFFSRGSNNLQQQIKAAVGPSVDASLYGSLPEMRALLRLYGPYFAVEVATKLEPSLQEWVLSLNVVLKTNESLLKKLSESHTEPHRCLDAAHHAVDLKAALQVFRQLGRTLFMRQLTAIACDMELSASVPYMAAAIDCARAHAAWRGHSLSGGGGEVDCAAASGTADGSSSLSALLGLPPPAICCGPNSPGSDPVLKFFFTEVDAEVFERWRLLPLLAGLLLAGGDWSHAAWLPQWEALSHDFHCLPHVMHCLAVAMEEASLERGDVEPTTAGAVLSTFSRCAGKVALSQGSPHPAQLVMLESMTCAHHRRHHLSASASVPGCLAAACLRSTYRQRAHSQA